MLSNKTQKMSTKTPKTSKQLKTNIKKQNITESKAKPKPNATYLSNRSKKCSTSTTNTASISGTTSAVDNNNNKNNIKVKKSNKTVKESKSTNTCKIRKSMHKTTTSSTNSMPIPVRTKSKPQMSSTPHRSTEDDINEMPVLTPEVPFESAVDNILIDNCIKAPVFEPNYGDLVPPVLSPALDQHLKNKMSDNCDKNRNKRKSKVESIKSDHFLDDSLYHFSDNNSDNVLSMGMDLSSNKKFKQSLKKSKMSKNFFENRKNSFQKQMFENRKKFQKYLNFSQNSQNLSSSNEWSVDSNHTISSLMSSNTSMASTQTAKTIIKYRKISESNDNNNGMDWSQNNSLLAHNSSIFGNSFKSKPKLLKKSKLYLNKRQTMGIEGNSSAKKTLFNELIGVQKPEPEVDEIEGMVFQSFETEESIKLFAKFEELEREQREQSLISKTFKIKSLKSGKLIFPTKTKDITKIKGWREKLFPNIENKSKRPLSLCKLLDNSPTNQNNNKLFKPLISDPTIAQTSRSGSKSAFVSDLLDGYLKTKSDLKLNYLSPDFAPPPDDSPIFSASVLRMPEFTTSSMPPPYTQSSLQSTYLSNSANKKGNSGRSKGLKNKLSLKTDFSSDSIGFLEDEEDISKSELLLPQYPVIRETLWPDTPLSDDHLSQLYNDYISHTYHEMQLLKRPTAPSFIMDDMYARFALGALQCNERIPSPNEDSNECPDNVLLAVGLAPKAKELSPVKDMKITGRYRKDREADLAKIIAMGNRSKRQIRLPSRFHESSLLMGNQWVIPDYDSKGKTGKRRLIEEQKRLQELHQKQLEIENRKQPVPSLETTSAYEDSQYSLLHKKVSKSKLKGLNIPTVPLEYPLKIPHQRLKQMQIIRDQKNQKNVKQINEQKLEKSFTSLYAMSTQTVGDKRILSLSAKAAASASQRAVVNNLFLNLADTIGQDKSSMVYKNGKINKLETIKEAIESINKLNKREQQLNYIKKMLSMWNHKLVLCQKVSSKDMKVEEHSYKVVTEVVNAYKNSVCYKVGKAIDQKRKEFQEKRLQMSAKQTPDSSDNKKLVNSSQVINIPNTITNTTVQSFKTPIKPQKALTQRYILPKLSPQLSTKSKSETVSSVNTLNKYPILTTPDLHQRNVNDISETELKSKEGSLLKPPILTTRPTVLKPFIIPSTEGLHSSTSVTGPIINIPNISRIKSMSKAMNICSTGATSLIAPTKSHLSSNFKNSSIKSKLVSNSKTVPNVLNTTRPSSSQSNATHPFNSHPYSKSVIITSETPLASEDLTKIMASITANPDRFKKLPVRLSNGMAALTIPGPLDLATTSKITNQTSSPNLTIGSANTMNRSKTNTKSFESIADLRSNSATNQLQTNGSNDRKQHIFKNRVKLSQQMTEPSKTVSALTDDNDCIQID